jgi:hypothetical protein
MKLYENFINDGALTNFYGGKTDSGFKLQINGEEKMKEKGTITTSEGTGGYNNKPLNQFKITTVTLTAVEWLQEQYNQCPKYEEQIYEQDWEKAKEMEKNQIMRTARQCYFEGVRKRAKTTEELIEYAEQYYNETFKQQEQ